MFEHRKQPLLPRHGFSKRMFKFGVFSAVLVMVSLVIGMIGYHLFGQLSWVDSFVNASMILTGMGPVDRMDTIAAKIFSGIYALFSGVIFLTAAAVLFSPLLHRSLHRFHLELEDDDEESGARKATHARSRAKRG